MSDSTSALHMHEFIYGRSKIEYQLEFEDRKNLAITVRPDKSVIVKAPLGSNLKDVQKKLLEKGQWVLKQINYFDKFHPIQPQRQYISGETHYYLGRQYRLRIRKGSEEQVKLKGKFFIAKTQQPDSREHIEFLMNAWYADHAKMLIDRRLEIYAKKILGDGFSQVLTRYKFMKRRWGSYNPKGYITFNIELVKTPIQCVDYVIVHELCHLIHPNHDKAFYNALGKAIPDWRERKEQLDLFAVK